ncbi:hypothetical protein SVAN01_04630 [Stagonosporopsis vannaccii]|nr:hypothetical protein SVAN01_04630 [Stagonosporopsis vannaccii]
MGVTAAGLLPAAAAAAVLSCLITCRLGTSPADLVQLQSLQVFHAPNFPFSLSATLFARHLHRSQLLSLSTPAPRLAPFKLNTEIKTGPGAFLLETRLFASSPSFFPQATSRAIAVIQTAAAPGPAPRYIL